jgi:hypothetical protein
MQSDGIEFGRSLLFYKGWKILGRAGGHQHSLGVYDNLLQSIYRPVCRSYDSLELT